MSIPLSHVLAHWAYSEVLDGTQAANYQGDGIEALRAKRERGVDFADLSDRERYLLAFHCGWLRPLMLRFFAGIDSFELVPMDRTELGDLIVPPNVWRDSENKFVPFRRYVNATTDETGDSRVVKKPEKYNAPTDPLTIGYCPNGFILADGYHRAVTFWRFGRNESLRAYVPNVSSNA